MDDKSEKAHVDVDEDAGLLLGGNVCQWKQRVRGVIDTHVAGVDARDSDERAGRAAAAVLDVDLSAGDLWRVGL